MGAEGEMYCPNCCSNKLEPKASNLRFTLDHTEDPLAHQDQAPEFLIRRPLRRTSRFMRNLAWSKEAKEDTSLDRQAAG